MKDLIERMIDENQNKLLTYSMFSVILAFAIGSIFEIFFKISSIEKQYIFISITSSIYIILILQYYKYYLKLRQKDASILFDDNHRKGFKE